MQQPPTFTLDGFLERISHGQQVAADYVRVESEPDENIPGRTRWALNGATKGAVERRMALILEEAADAGGRGRFVGPGKTSEGLYGALGETIIPVMVEAAE